METSHFPTKLTIRVSDTRLCFARYELRREPLFAFSSWQLRQEFSLLQNLREAMDREELLQAPTSHIEILCCQPVTPVPLADFQEEDCTNIYKYVFHQERPHRVFYDTLPCANAVLLYGMKEEVCRAIEEVFGQVHYTSALTSLLAHLSQKGLSNGTGRRFFCHIHNNAMDFAAFNYTRLELINTYEIHNTADAAYYAFNAAQKLGADTRQDSFFITGNKAEREKTVEEFRQFAANVYGVNPTAEYNRSIVATTPGVPYDMITFLME